MKIKFILFANTASMGNKYSFIVGEANDRMTFFRMSVSTESLVPGFEPATVINVESDNVSLPDIGNLKLNLFTLYSAPTDVTVILSNDAIRQKPYKLFTRDFDEMFPFLSIDSWKIFPNERVVDFKIDGTFYGIYAKYGPSYGKSGMVTKSGTVSQLDFKTFSPNSIYYRKANVAGLINVMLSYVDEDAYNLCKSGVCLMNARIEDVYFKFLSIQRSEYYKNENVSFYLVVFNDKAKNEKGEHLIAFYA